jgi:hypothetical protein
MEFSFATEAWALARRFWVIVMQHPQELISGGFPPSTLLQAEDSGVTYVLAFTSELKAAAAIEHLGVRAQAHTAELKAGAGLDLVSAVCRHGACGIMVDFDATADSTDSGARRWAWRRRLVSNA